MGRQGYVVATIAPSERVHKVLITKILDFALLSLSTDSSLPLHELDWLPRTCFAQHLRHDLGSDAMDSLHSGQIDVVMQWQ